jgi:hypothetical protein
MFADNPEVVGPGLLVDKVGFGAGLLILFLWSIHK